MQEADQQFMAVQVDCQYHNHDLDCLLHKWRLDLGLKLQFVVCPERKITIQFYPFPSKSDLLIIFIEATAQDGKTHTTCGEPVTDCST